MTRKTVIGLVAGLSLLASACGGEQTIPDLVGHDVADATALLDEEGLQWFTFETEDEEVPAGQVIAHLPEAGDGFTEGEPEEVMLVVAIAPTYALGGSFTLIDDGNGGGEDGCYGTGGYDDIQGGLNVTVRDGTGTIVATGGLGRSSQTFSGACEFPITVRQIPRSDFYVVEVGHRGEITYSFEDLVANSWEIFLSLG